MSWNSRHFQSCLIPVSQSLPVLDLFPNPCFQLDPPKTLEMSCGLSSNSLVDIRWISGNTADFQQKICLTIWQISGGKSKDNNISCIVCGTFCLMSAKLSARCQPELSTRYLLDWQISVWLSVWISARCPLDNPPVCLPDCLMSFWQILKAGKT